MKKGLLIVAIVLFLGAAVAVALSVQSFMSYSDQMTVSDEQAAKAVAAEKVGNTDQSLRFLEYSTDNATFANEVKREGYYAVGGAVLLLIAGVVVLLRSRKMVA